MCSIGDITLMGLNETWEGTTNEATSRKSSRDNQRGSYVPHRVDTVVLPSSVLLRSHCMYSADIRSDSQRGRLDDRVSEYQRC